MDLYHITYEFTPTVYNKLCMDVYIYLHREGELCLYLYDWYVLMDMHVYI